MALLSRCRCPTLKDAPFVPRTLWDAAHHETSVFDDIREQDRLRAPPVRLVLGGRDVHPPGGRRPARRRDQDDALPHRPGLAAHRSADRRGRGRQAGRGARRAQGAIRRAQQHQVGDTARIGRRPRRLRRREPEDALQAVPRRAQGIGRRPALRPHRHRQLQPRRPRRSTPTSACSPPIRRSATTCRTCSTT